MMMTSTSDIAQIFEEQRFTPTNQLMLTLLTEKKKANSIFKSYLDVLPQKFWTSLYFNYDESKTLQKSKIRGNFLSII
jgi:lambda repressor-like predicted transcriptional regulator